MNKAARITQAIKEARINLYGKLLLDQLPLQANHKINRLKLKGSLSTEMEVGMQ
jgi:hypothetical protein